MWLDELSVLMPPPADARRPAVSAEDWARAEAGLGFALPPDFKTFAETWGPGDIGGFFRAYTPISGYHPAISLPSGTLGQARAYATLKGNDPSFYPLPAFPAEGSLMSLAVTDNGDYIGLVVGPGETSRWPTAVLDSESRRVQVFEGQGFGPVILGVVSGALRPEQFPKDLWETTPLRFEPLPRDRPAP